MFRLPKVQRIQNIESLNFIEFFKPTRSYAALRAPDLVMTHGMRKCSFFVTNAGSQLTFMTQNEKVIIFRDQRGVTTDLLDV